MKKWFKKIVTLNSKSVQLLPFIVTWGVFSFSLFLLGAFLGYCLTFLYQIKIFQNKIPQNSFKIPANHFTSSNKNGIKAIYGEKNIFLFQEGSHFILSKITAQNNLKVLKVFQLTRHFDRFPQNPKNIALHGYYFDDLTISKKKILEKQYALFLKVGKKPFEIIQNAEKAIQLAEKIATLGGILFLMDHSSQKNPPHLRKAVALALGKRKYKEAIPYLLVLLQSKNKTLQKKVLQYLEDITQLKLIDKKINIDIIKTRIAHWKKQLK